MAYTKIIEETYKKLDAVKADKKERITALFKHVEDKAEFLKQDDVMHDFFFYMEKTRKYPAENKEERDTVTAEYCKVIDRYYLHQYLDFYDALFIDSSGELFYSIRNGAHFTTNIFNSELSQTKLSKSLTANRNITFVDYQYYTPAGEPAAFFVVPMLDHDTLRGWIVLQYAVNRLNTMMVDYQELGDTGEIYLVNKDHMILTNSRFNTQDASLKLKVNTEAVNSAFLSGAGHKLITGYRGVRVFTAYEKLSVWGADWALVASIEEDEIVTNYYLQHKDLLSTKAFRALDSCALHQDALSPVGGKVIKVDIDEYHKAHGNDMLETYGVSTCTAIAIFYPDHFAYLAHISPFDKIYGQFNLTNQLKDMVGRVKYNDIYLRELRELKVVVVANHLNSIETVIEKLSKYGIRLSQVIFAYNSGAQYANVTCRGDGTEMVIEWVNSTDGSGSWVQNIQDINTIGATVRSIATKPLVR